LLIFISSHFAILLDEVIPVSGLSHLCVGSLIVKVFGGGALPLDLLFLHLGLEPLKISIFFRCLSSIRRRLVVGVLFGVFFCL